MSCVLITGCSSGIGLATALTWQLRHPAGPDAQAFLGWRASMTDEEWVNWGALDDETWYQRVQSDFGLDARPKEAPRAAGA